MVSARRLLALRQLDVGEKLSDFLGICGAVRTVYEATIEVRGEKLREVVHIFPQQRAAAETDPGRVSGEQVTRIDGDQVCVVFLEGHVGDDAYTQAQANICLDHVGITSSNGNVGRQAGLRERIVQRARSSETERIGDERILRE